MKYLKWCFKALPLWLMAACTPPPESYVPLRQLLQPDRTGVVRGFSPGMTITQMRKQEKAVLLYEDLHGPSYKIPMPAGWEGDCAYLGNNDSVLSVIVTATTPGKLQLDSLNQLTEAWLTSRYGEARVDKHLHIWRIPGAEIRMVQQLNQAEFLLNVVMNPSPTP